MASTTSADFPPTGPGPSLNRSAAGTFAAKIGAAILLYGTSVLVGRFLGPDGSGLLGVVQVGAEIAVAAAALGTPFAAAYYGSRRPRHGPALLGNGLLFSAVLGVVFVAVAVALSGTISDLLDRPTDTRLWAVAALLVPVTMLHHWLANLLRARRDFRRYNRLLLGTQAGTLVLTIVLLGVFDLGALAAVLTLIGGRLVLVVGALPILARDGVALSARLFRASVRYGMRLQPGHLVGMANARLDVLLVAAFAGTSATGSYYVAQTLADAVLVLPLSLGAVLLPSIAAGRGTDTVTHPALRLCGTICLVQIGVSALVGPVLIRWGYGPAFTPAIAPFLILLPGLWFVAFATVLSETLRGRGKPGTASVLGAVSFALILTLDLVLIPPYGAVGAAVASAVGYTVYGLLSLVYVARVDGVPVRTLLVTTPAETRALLAAVRRLVRRRT
jgi:O-antigen/teichoic acid export membrane protein